MTATVTRHCSERGERITIARADKVSGIDFFDAITGSSPAKRQERDRKMREQCIRAIQRGDTYGWPPAMVEDCEKIIAERADHDRLEQALRGQLTQTQGDPFLKRRVA